MIAGLGAAMIAAPASYLAVHPCTRRHNPFVTGLFENSPPRYPRRFPLCVATLSSFRLPKNLLMTAFIWACAVVKYGRYPNQMLFTAILW